MTWAIFKDSHLEAVRELTQSTSDRVVAIVGVAFLDDTLKMTLLERFRNDNDIANKLTKVSGALGNTAPKIDVLYLLGAFDQRMRDALYGLSKIRNEFAHNLEASFTSKDKNMRDSTALLTLHEGRSFYPHPFLGEESSIPLMTMKGPRDIFIVNLQLCLIALMRDRSSHFPWSNIPYPNQEILPDNVTGRKP